jgi:16S rRNA (cytosine1402-N4)-methyltransferase
MLELSAPNGIVLGIDADPAALEAAATRLAPFGDRVRLVESYFDDLAAIVQRLKLGPADGILFDLGVSSPQLDISERGFSFLREAPLDMRFGPGANQSAADLVRTLPADELQRIFREYGEERYARRIAQRIAEERRRRPIETTSQLAALVARAKPASRESIHPATRVFQALRIAVNDELGRLQRALPQAIDALRVGGRVAVISFHSLEDRIVKTFMRQEARGCICPPDLPVCVCGREPRVRILTSRPRVASQAEVAQNPRARSAKLRVAERIA